MGIHGKKNSLEDGKVCAKYKMLLAQEYAVFNLSRAVCNKQKSIVLILLFSTANFRAILLRASQFARAYKLSSLDSQQWS